MISEKEFNTRLRLSKHFDYIIGTFVAEAIEDKLTRIGLGSDKNILTDILAFQKDDHNGAECSTDDSKCEIAVDIGCLSFRLDVVYDNTK